MISIFLFLYSIGIVLNEVKEIKNICQKLIKVILNGIMAAGVSAVFLIPIAISLTTNSGGFVSLKLYLRCIFTDIMYSFYLGNFDTYLPNGRPMLYCGIFSIILLFVYLKSKETVKREKIIDTIILLILLLSIEIAPILGLSDVIVDIVETGTTLKENDLVVSETIVPISARLISNKVSFKFKTAEIEKIAAALKEQVENK